MRLPKIMRVTHKWTGVFLTVFLLNLAVTGFLLLQKKQYDWLQPDTQEGAAGGVEDFITSAELIEVVLQQGHPGFQTLADIDRIDFRPDKRIHKVRSRRSFAEIQVDAVTGQVLNVAERRSDLLENIHDGSFLAHWFHLWIMPLAALGLVFLCGSGLYLWLRPVLSRNNSQSNHQPPSP
ncbi:MAG: PepSY-associated TM helix domain-containing protein [bacterium]